MYLSLYHLYCLGTAFIHSPFKNIFENSLLSLKYWICIENTMMKNRKMILTLPSGSIQSICRDDSN